MLQQAGHDEQYSQSAPLQIDLHGKVEPHQDKPALSPSRIGHERAECASVQQRSHREASANMRRTANSCREKAPMLLSWCSRSKVSNPMPITLKLRAVKHFMNTKHFTAD